MLCLLTILSADYYLHALDDSDNYLGLVSGQDNFVDHHLQWQR